ncbi:MAG: hypothetical protein ACUVUB_05305 [Candidatus Bathyarchaeia archaeon]
MPTSIRRTLRLREGGRLQLSTGRGAIILRPERAITVDDIK